MSLQNNEGFSSDSDDDDYIPSAEESDDKVVTSEDDEKEKKEVDSQHKTAKRKSRKQLLPRKRKGGIKLKGEVVSENSGDDDDDEDEDDDDVKKSNDDAAVSKNDVPGHDKDRVDALWTNFLKDSNSKAGKQSSSKDSNPPEKEKKATSKFYEFAGEEFRINEEGASSDMGMLSSNKQSEKKLNESSTTETLKSIGSSKFPIKKTGGLGSIMGKISGKATKINTLEKSRLDWKAYKTEEGIEEDVVKFNKGKDGYLERQAFLQRTDLRQFELERNIRQNNRSNR